MSPSQSSGTLAELSSQLATAVETAGKSVVAIHARRRIPSSGIVWRDGVVVSASQTVRRNDDISVTLPTGESATATVAGRDAATDLVALRLTGATPRVALRADADALSVGSIVLAVGRAGRDITASFGIISAVAEDWRTVQGARIDRVLRLDLAVYDGFSGGPLVDTSGRVVGLNNSALARGTPIALPAAVVDRVLDELLQRGHVRRAYLGVAVHPVALGGGFAKHHQLASEIALMVMSVAEGGPAERAGLLIGDVLIEANGQPLRRPSDLLDALSGVRDGSQLVLTFLRGGTRKSLSVTPGDRNAAGAEEQDE
jgi:S1-C subfamily serine protease